MTISIRKPSPIEQWNTVAKRRKKILEENDKVLKEKFPEPIGKNLQGKEVQTFIKDEAFFMDKKLTYGQRLQFFKVCNDIEKKFSLSKKEIYKKIMRKNFNQKKMIIEDLIRLEKWFEENNTEV